MKTIIIAAVVGFLAGGGATLAITKSVKPEIKLECPQAKLSCPEQKPCNGIDFDKIKSRAITIQNTQYLTVDGDSLVLDAYREILQQELARLKLARCK